MANDYQDVVLNLLKAVDIISSDKVSSLPYDRTIVAEIIVNKDAKKGEYIVSDGSSEFKAYSDNTDYALGTKVYVTIPNGDWDEKKIIKGKCMAADTEYYTYTSPLNDFLDITDNLVDVTPEGSTINNSTVWGLTANGSIKERTIWQAGARLDNLTQLDRFLSPSLNKVLQTGYSRLALSAYFNTKLSSFGLYQGTYGLKLYLYTYAAGDSTNNEGEDRRVNEYVFTLDSDDFFGNPYTFEVEQQQSLLFDISEIKNPIVGMRLVFFQGNDFIGDDGVIKYDGNEIINIFMRSPHVSLGHSINEFKEETPILYCLDSMSYRSNSENNNSNGRTLYMRWIHRKESGGFYCIDQANEIPFYTKSSGASGTVNDSKAILRLFRACSTDSENGLETEDSSIAGPGWKEIWRKKYAAGDTNKLNYNVELNPQLPRERFKFIIEYPCEEYRSNALVQTEQSQKALDIYNALMEDYSQAINLDANEVTATAYDALMENDYNKLGTISIETAKKQLELLYKKYIAEENKIIDPVAFYESEILEFINESEVPNYVTLDLINGLHIVCDTEQYNGNFQCYRSDNVIANDADSKKDRYLQAIFNSVRSGFEEYDGPASITWYFPIGNSMIEMPEEGVTYVTANTNVSKYVLENDVSVRKTKKLIGADDSDSWYRTVEDVKADVEYGPLFVDSFGIVDDSESKFNGMYYLTRNDVEIVDNNDSHIIGINIPKQLEQKFRIKPIYNYTAVDNTIGCELKKNGRVYQEFYEMTFGISGNNGTKYTFNLSFANGEFGWQYGETQSLTIIPHLYDYNNREQTINPTNLIYSWYSENHNVVKNSNGEVVSSTAGLKIDAKDDETGAVTIIPTGNATAFGDYEFYILRADLTQGAKLSASDSTPSILLTAYLPIPIRYNSTDWYYLYADSGWTISYDSSGTNPTYFKDPFILWREHKTNHRKETCSGTNWEWQIILGSDTTAVSPLSDNGRFYPRFNENNILVPTGMMVQNLGKNIAARCLYNSNGTKYVRYSLPIMITQYGYESQLLNSWDGALNIDKEGNTILSAMVGAGVKHPNNAFSGVLMGDVSSKAGFNKTGIGLWGFQNGAQSFGFNVDGTAFIGRAGWGRIEFDGNRSTIKSSSYDQTDGFGMKIDLDDGVIDIVGSQHTNGDTVVETLYDYVRDENGHIQKDEDGKYLYTTRNVTRTNYQQTKSHITLQSANPYFTIISDADKEIFRVSNEAIFLQTNDFNQGTSGVRINLTANDDFTDGSIGKNNYAGSIEAYGNFNIKAINTRENNRYKGSGITLSSSGNPYLRITHNDQNKYVPYSPSHAKDNTGVDKITNNLDGKLFRFETATNISNARFKLSGINVLEMTSDEISTMESTADTSASTYYTNYYKRVTVQSGDEYNNAIFYYKQGTGDINLLNFTSGTQELRSSNYVSNYSGTYLNLSNGTFNSYGSFTFRAIQTSGTHNSTTGQTGFILSSSGNPFFQIISENKTLLYISNRATNGYYLQTKNFNSGSAGVKIDLDGGKIEAYNNFRIYAKNTSGTYNGSYIDIRNSSPYFTIHATKTTTSGTTTTTLDNDLIKIADNSYYLQTINYNESQRTGTKIDLGNGRIQSYNFTILAYGTGDNSKNWIQIKSSHETTPLAIGGETSANAAKFHVNWDGTLHATGAIISGNIISDSGTIGGWNISGTALYHGDDVNAPTHYLGAAKTLSVIGSNKNNIVFKAGTGFGVDSNGTLYSNSGNIGGWNIGGSALYHYTGQNNINHATHYIGAAISANTFNATDTNVKINDNFRYGSGKLNESTARIMMKLGSNFVVSNTGTIWATGVNISGNITADSGTIGGVSIGSDGKIASNMYTAMKSLIVDEIKATDISASHITSGTLDASTITVSNLKVSHIGDFDSKVESIVANTISATTISAENVIVDNRSLSTYLNTTGLPVVDSLTYTGGGDATSFTVYAYGSTESVTLSGTATLTYSVSYNSKAASNIVSSVVNGSSTTSLPVSVTFPCRTINIGTESFIGFIAVAGE